MKTKFISLFICLSFLLIFGVGMVSALTFDISVTETNNITRDNWITTAGIPFYKGEVSSLNSISLKDGSTELPFDAKILSTYSDGSIRTAIFNFELDLNPLQSKNITVRTDDSTTNYQGIITIQTNDNITVNTGVINITFSYNNIISSIFYNGTDILNNSDGYNVNYTLFDSENNASYQEVIISNLSIDYNGSQKTVIKAHTLGQLGIKNYTYSDIYFTLYKNKSLVKIDNIVWTNKSLPSSGNVTIMNSRLTYALNPTLNFKNISLNRGDRTSVYQINDGKLLIEDGEDTLSWDDSDSRVNIDSSSDSQVGSYSMNMTITSASIGPFKLFNSMNWSDLNTSKMCMWVKSPSSTDSRVRMNIRDSGSGRHIYTGFLPSSANTWGYECINLSTPTTVVSPLNWNDIVRFDFQDNGVFANEGGNYSILFDDIAIINVSLNNVNVSLETYPNETETDINVNKYIRENGANFGGASSISDGSISFGIIDFDINRINKGITTYLTNNSQNYIINELSPMSKNQRYSGVFSMSGFSLSNNHSNIYRDQLLLEKDVFVNIDSARWDATKLFTDDIGDNYNIYSKLIKYLTNNYINYPLNNVSLDGYDVIKSPHDEFTETLIIQSIRSGNYTLYEYAKDYQNDYMTKYTYRNVPYIDGTGMCRGGNFLNEGSQDHCSGLGDLALYFMTGYSYYKDAFDDMILGYNLSIDQTGFVRLVEIPNGAWDETYYANEGNNQAIRGTDRSWRILTDMIRYRLFFNDNKYQYNENLALNYILTNQQSDGSWCHIMHNVSSFTDCDKRTELTSSFLIIALEDYYNLTSNQSVANALINHSNWLYSEKRDDWTFGYSENKTGLTPNEENASLMAMRHAQGLITSYKLTGNSSYIDLLDKGVHAIFSSLDNSQSDRWQFYGSPDISSSIDSRINPAILKRWNLVSPYLTWFNNSNNFADTQISQSGSKPALNFFLSNNSNSQLRLVFTNWRTNTSNTLTYSGGNVYWYNYNSKNFTSSKTNNIVRDWANRVQYTYFLGDISLNTIEVYTNGASNIYDSNNELIDDNFLGWIDNTNNRTFLENDMALNLNITIKNNTNALIYNTNGSIYGNSDISLNDGNINITLTPNNASYVLDNFNLTEGVIRTNSPLWFSSSSNTVKHIASNLTDSITTTIVFDVDTCESIGNIYYTPKDGSKVTYQRGSYSCNNNQVTISLQINPSPESNVLEIEYACSSLTIVGYRLIALLTALAILGVTVGFSYMRYQDGNFNANDILILAIAIIVSVSLYLIIVQTMGASCPLT